MDITVLYENTKKEERLISGHGLSLYIETHGKKILLDTGMDESFLENAKMLGVDISSVDIAVMSHFHYDHTGGLSAFLNANTKAKVYIGRDAFDEYFVDTEDGMKNFSMNGRYDMGRFELVAEMMQLDENLILISKIDYAFDNPLNDKFYKKTDGGIVKDDFSHEVGLIIIEGENKILLSGCFHSGVINFAKSARESGFDITHIIGGFHLVGLEGEKEGTLLFNNMKEFIKGNNIVTYTGHCTGDYYKGLLIESEDIISMPLYTGVKYKVV